MNYSFFSNIHENTYIDIISIINQCQNIDNIKYSVFAHEEISQCMVWIAYNENTPVGFLLCTDVILQEAFGMVIPEYRKRGIFTHLYNLLIIKMPAEQITFYGKKHYPGIFECTKSLGYTNHFEELLMRYTGNEPDNCCPFDVEFEDGTYFYYDGDTLIGQCSVLEEESTINIYEVYVDERYRNKGYGKSIIKDVVWDLYKSGKTIQLHVTGDNIPAVSCYTGCGFETADSIIYFTQETT